MEVPADALKDLTKLRTLVLHDNLIQVGQMIAIDILIWFIVFFSQTKLIDYIKFSLQDIFPFCFHKVHSLQTLGGVVALGPMANLQHLDLTRNNIGELPTGTFRQLSGLKILKLAVNSMRQVNRCYCYCWCVWSVNIYYIFLVYVRW